jgi:hypothetical protein
MDAPTNPKHRRFAFSVRMLLLLVLVIATWLGWAVHKARQQREAVAAIEKFGGWVHYDYEFVNGPVNVPSGNNLWLTTWGKLTPGREPRAPHWLRRALGDEYFQDIAHVSLFVDIQKGTAYASKYNIGPADDALAKLSTQTKVKTLQIGGEQVNDRNLAHVGKLTSLEELIIFPGTDVSDAGLAHLAGLKRLRIFLLSNSRLTDDGLASLASLTNLEELVLDGAGFSDRGIAHLMGMTRLESLSLGGGQHTITNAGLKSLESMRNLKTLNLSGWKITDEGVDRLLRLKMLKTVYLEGTSVTEVGRSKLKAAGLKVE